MDDNPRLGSYQSNPKGLISPLQQTPRAPSGAAKRLQNPENKQTPHPVSHTLTACQQFKNLLWHPTTEMMQELIKNAENIQQQWFTWPIFFVLLHSLANSAKYAKVHIGLGMTQTQKHKPVHISSFRVQKWLRWLSRSSIDRRVVGVDPPSPQPTVVVS